MEDERVNMEFLVFGVLAETGKLNLRNLRLFHSCLPTIRKKMTIELLAWAHMAGFNLAAENALYAIDYFRKCGHQTALEEISRLSALYGNIKAIEKLAEIDLKPVYCKIRKEFILPDRNNFSAEPDTEEVFLRYCRENDITVLKKIQSGVRSIRYSSFVYLAIDNDGIIKIFKELLDYKSGSGSIDFNDEAEIYERMAESRCGRNYYGRIDIAEGISFLKLGFVYGRPLSDLIVESGITIESAGGIIKLAAEKLEKLHRLGIYCHDLKPEHIILGGNEAYIIDFGVSRFIKDGETDVYLASPRYGAPEEGERLKASFATDIFRLGIIFHELATGKHPFGFEEKGQFDREEEVLRYFWPNMVLPYGLKGNLEKREFEIIGRMLDKRPENRPSAKEIIEELKECRISVIEKRKHSANNEKAVLFPARMGIPHKGHIEYISRLIDLGFHVIISIQRSYTITDRDPVPKWLVAKMVAKSLLVKGYSQYDFSITLTPFFRTNAEMKMHFVMMPGIENVIAVASSNPSVHELFDGYLTLDQKSVFGNEGEIYEEKSWGEILRQAVKDVNYEKFREYAADGIEYILPFSCLRTTYAKPFIEFVPGRVLAVLSDAEGRQIVRTAVNKYLGPEESLIRKLRQDGNYAEISDPLSKYTICRINGKKHSLIYSRTDLEGDDEVIYFTKE
jgi:serine/threonine protein kinase